MEPRNLGSVSDLSKVCMILTSMCFIFSMVITRHGAGGLGSGSGSRSGLGAGSEQVDYGLCEFIASEITRGILEATPVIFGSIKEGIIELMEDRLRTFKSDLASR